MNVCVPALFGVIDWYYELPFTYTFHLCKYSQFIFHKYLPNYNKHFATTKTHTHACVLQRTEQGVESFMSSGHSIWHSLSIFAANFPLRFAPVRYQIRIHRLRSAPRCPLPLQLPSIRPSVLLFCLLFLLNFLLSHFQYFA